MLFHESPLRERLSALLMKNIKTVWFRPVDKRLQACEKIHADCRASLNWEPSAPNKASAGDLQFIRTNGLMDRVHISFEFAVDPVRQQQMRQAT